MYPIASTNSHTNAFIVFYGKYEVIKVRETFEKTKNCMNHM